MKSPGSPVQTAAAQANGAKPRGPVKAEGKRAPAADSANSTGPVTLEGKPSALTARPSQNDTKHGRLARSIAMAGEVFERFTALLDSLTDLFTPRTCVESALVENMAVARWR